MVCLLVFMILTNSCAPSHPRLNMYRPTPKPHAPPTCDGGQGRGGNAIGVRVQSFVLCCVSCFVLCVVLVLCCVVDPYSPRDPWCCVGAMCVGVVLLLCCGPQLP